MGCKIAENEPLKRLRSDLGLPIQCHSLRENCVHKLQRPIGNGTMGIPGAAIGYCQALFNKESDSKTNTQKIINNLREINAPWYLSHELFWGDKGEEPIENFISNSMEPLLGSGRIPILITPLNMGSDIGIVKEILSIEPKVLDGETTLLRVVLSDKQSLDNTIMIINSQVSNAIANKNMPKWWLLLQGNLSHELWEYFRKKIGENWKYCNIAVNPFTVGSLPDFCWEQVTVGQVVVGHKEGIANNGIISLPTKMKISGAKECDSYNLFDYFTRLSKLNTSPTLIILGPSLDEWTNEYNKERLQKLVPLLIEALPLLWNDLPLATVKKVLKLTA